MAKLIVNPTTGTGAEIGLDGLTHLGIGRAPHNDLVVPRRMASREHAVIEQRDGRYFVSDRESYNGTFVNQAPIREVELRHGDEIQIANYVLRFIAEPTLSEVATAVGVAAPKAVDDNDTTDPLLPLVDDVPPAERPTAPLHVEAKGAAAAAGAFRPFDRGDASPPTLSSATSDSEPDHAFTVPTEQEFDSDLVAMARAEHDDRVQRPASPALRLPARPPAAPASWVTGTPVAPVDDSPLTDWRLWLVAIAIVALLITALTRGGDDDPDQHREAGALDSRALRTAIEAAPSQRAQLLWDFISDYPASPLREAAYLELIAGGATRSLVCERARTDSPELLYDGGKLKAACDAR